MIKQLGLILLVCCSAIGDTLTTNIISADRTNNWTPSIYTGVLGGMLTNRAVYTNMTGIDNTGATDVLTAIQTAYNNCPSNQAVVLPAGRFKMANGTLTPNGWTTLRGSGMTNTVLVLDATQIDQANDNSTFNIYSAGAIISGATRGSTNIVLADTSGFAVGFLCLIAQFSSTNQFDNPVVVGTGGTNLQNGYVKRIVARVVAKTAGSITFWPPLVSDMSAAGRAQVSRAMPFVWFKGGYGFEDFTIELTNAQHGISLGGVYDCWIKNVKVKNANNYSVILAESVNMEMNGCWLDDLNHGGSNGSGLLMNTVSGSLIENNIIVNSFPNMEINSGSSGNVFAYNFCMNTNGQVAIDSNHGPHNSFNLFEGNVMTSFTSDGYFGSDSEGTVYRNWINGIYTFSGLTDPLKIGYAFSLKRFTRKYSAVGNIFVSGAPYVNVYDGTAYGQPHINNPDDNGTNAPPWADWLIPQAPGVGYDEFDTNVLATIIRFGNYDYFTNGIPSNQAIGTNVLVSSLYLTTQPYWWGSFSNAWPPIDPTTGTSRQLNSLTNDVMIPAQQRWLTLTNGDPVINTLYYPPSPRIRGF